ncbi:MAG: AarF/ABC1/UbiB kinase family protein [Cyclobacteriaceae bacterium]
MRELSKIPVSKVERASKFISTGAKVGRNYIKHYGRKIVDKDATREQLDLDNASDIYGSLSELKGSALKVAQMLAMDKNLMPTAYQDQFALGQYSAPPLSYPLVVKTFQKYFSATPSQMFDTFSKNAINAASIGQVHRATKDGKTYAVKIQYPGVAESITSDLKMVRPFALRLFNLNEVELDHYMEEVEGKLLEETDYALELDRSMSITKNTAHIKNLFFPEYYPEYSSERVISMDWLEGQHMKEFLKTDPSQEVRNSIGQALWDFYHHQIHELKEVHADPHPGNFMMREDGTLGIIDFGCVKVIPEDFYDAYFRLISKDLVTNDEQLLPILYDLNFIYDDDSTHEKKIFIDTFKTMTQLLGRPFHFDSFDFSDESFFNEIYTLSERLSKMKEFRNSKHPRGSRHGLYVNRTYFGLYNLLHDLGAEVSTTKPDWIK